MKVQRVVQSGKHEKRSRARKEGEQGDKRKSRTRQMTTAAMAAVMPDLPGRTHRYSVPPVRRGDEETPFEPLE